MRKIKIVYIIDDDEVIIYLSNKLLAKESFCEKTITFTNANQALEALKNALLTNNEVPDLILFDLNMPGMDGWMFVEEFKKLNCQIPTFVFSSSIDPIDTRKAGNLREIKDFITKPLTKISLGKIMRLMD